MPHSFYISCPRFTTRVDTDDSYIITGGAQLINKFIGQSVENLIEWCKADEIEEIGK